jgi:hypothetical protein
VIAKLVSIALSRAAGKGGSAAIDENIRALDHSQRPLSDGCRTLVLVTVENSCQQNVIRCVQSRIEMSLYTSRLLSRPECNKYITPRNVPIVCV